VHDPLGKEAQAKAGGGAAQLARFPGVAGEHGLDEVRPQVPREPRPLSTFAEPRSKVDAKLKEVGEQALSDQELYALRLYTGPQYLKYNSTLRGAMAEGTSAEHMHHRFLQLCRGNTYANTLHVISAAIVKLSKIAPATKVYRAPGGALPDSFWHRDATSGVQGGLEYAFMSTTMDKEEAMKYARRAPGMILFEIDQGFVARGASISWLSQYPQEEEVLYPPFTALEVSGTKIEGAVVVVGLRPSLSSAVAASGLRVGADDIRMFARERERVKNEREAAKAAEELRLRQLKQKMAEERGRWKYELSYQQKMANLRLSALRRKECQLSENLARSRHEARRVLWERAKQQTGNEAQASLLSAQVEAAKEMRKNASRMLKRAESQMMDSHKNLLEALEAKQKLAQTVGRRLWNILAASVREQSRAKSMNVQMLRGLSKSLSMRVSSETLDLAMADESMRFEEPIDEEPEQEEPPPVAAPPKDDFGIGTMSAAELVPKLKAWVGPQEQWVIGKTKATTELTMRACERLVELCSSAREGKEHRRAALDAGLLEILGFGMRKHVEEPVVVVHAFDAMRALVAKEKAKEVQRLGREAIPAVMHGAHAILNELLVTVVRALTKDSVDSTAFAMRVGCEVRWLDETSKVKLDENGGVIGDPGASKKRLT